MPDKHASEDKITVGCKVKIKFKMYDKDKPTKWGIKIFVLSLYICALDLCFDQTTTDRMDRADLRATSVSTQYPCKACIVINFVGKLKDAVEI